jgi:hypothetical protein
VKKASIGYKNLVLALGISISFLGCEAPTEIVDVGDSTAIVDLPASAPSPGPSSSPPPADPTKTVCDPFANNPDHAGSDLDHGIVANLKYLPDSAPRYTRAADYQTYGIPLDATLFFNDVNVPTRSFSLGFMTQSGVLIKNHQGNTLYEYFGVHFESQIQLTPANPIGPYQFAAISDDGSVVQVNRGSGFETLLNNDNVHASRFTGATQSVAFSSRDVKVPIRVDYFQGPRYHISMILLWRPWPSTGSSVDPQEGKSGNDLFFNSNQVPSVPSATYQGILSRGWRPVSAANFVLPDSVAQNPCHTVDPVTTTITSVTPSEVSTLNSSITFNFSSNYAAATFNCSLDGNTAVPCVPPISYAGLTSGAHQFAVFASANNQNDALGAKYTWEVLPPVATTITATNPATSITRQTSMSFTFASNYSGSTFKCRLDSGSLTSCTSPASYSGLSNGNHQFQAFASNSGFSDPQGATYNWTVDTVAPTLQLIGVSATSTSFTVRWTTNEPSTSRVLWGAGTSTSVTYEDTSWVTDHFVTIPGLSPFTIYSYTYGGSDAAGNSVNSAINRIRTAQ